MNLEAITILAKQVYDFVKPVFLNEATGKIIGDFKEATKGSILELWETIKPLFIIEEKEKNDLINSKDELETQFLDEELLAKLKRILVKKPELQDQLKAILSKIENGNDEKGKIIIQNAKNVVTGNISNVQGGLQIGDTIYGQSGPDIKIPKL